MWEVTSASHSELCLLGKSNVVFSPNPLPFFFCCKLNWSTAALSNSAVLLQLHWPFSASSWVSSEISYKPPKLETVWDAHCVTQCHTLSPLHFSLPQTGADQGTAMLTVLNVSRLQSKPLTPLSLLLNALLQVYWGSFFFLPVCISNQACWHNTKTNSLPTTLGSQCS